MSNLINPVRHSLAKNSDDTNKLKDTDSAGNPVVTCRGVSVNTAGVIAYKDKEGHTRLTGSLAAGVIHPIQTDQIMTTGTTALGVVFYW